MRTRQILLALLALLLFFIWNTLSSTGFFKDIEPIVKGEYIGSLSALGAEDIEISYADSFLIVSADDRGAFKTGRKREGALYFLDLNSEDQQLIEISQRVDFPFYPHGISLLKLNDSSYQLLAINHVGDEHSIESFGLQGDSLFHIRTYKDELLVSPNDVTLVAKERFYFTNDHRHRKGFWRLIEDYLGMSWSNVIYYNGQAYSEAVGEISYANGIAFQHETNKLFVASARGFSIEAFDVTDDGALAHEQSIALGTGPDNIVFDEKGRLLIGCHPNLMAFTSYATGKSETAPSEVIRIDYDDVGNSRVEQLMLDDGSQVAGSSVAVIFSDRLWVGNVMDDHISVIKLDQQ